MRLVNANNNSHKNSIVANRKGEKKNWNIFAGDNEYKKSFALTFFSDFTFDRFKQDKFQRLLLLIRGFIIGSMLFWAIGYFFFGFTGWVSFYAGFMLHGVSFYFAKAKFNPYYLRGVFFIIEYIMQRASFEYFEEKSFFMHLLIFNIPTFVISIF